MNRLFVAYSLISVVLLVLLIIAAFVHARVANLSIPVSPAVSILTIILPIVAFLTTYTHPFLVRRSHASSSRLGQLAPFIIQVLQGLIATILATLLFEGMAPSRGEDCLLEGEWMSMFRAHDAGGIRRIQDAFDCCGFNSVKDRAYPFPKTGPSTCAETYGRTIACRGRWREAMQNYAGADFSVVLIVGLIQIASLLIRREGATWWSNRQAQTNGVYESRRPLIAPASYRDEERAERQDRDSGHGYGSVNGVQADVNGDDSGPRVEPSGINEHNGWEH